MDFLLIGFGIFFLLLGISGCILPALPGPPLSYAALLLLHFTGKYDFSMRFLIVWALITLVVTVLDYLIPVWGTKRFGGSKRGIWGSIAGLIVGMFFFPPFGIILGPIAGAVLAELSGGKNHRDALRAGFGSFVGFLAGTLLKLIASGLMTWYFIAKLF